MAEVTASAHLYDRAGVEIINSLLPDREPFCDLWGTWDEVDLLMLGGDPSA